MNKNPKPRAEDKDAAAVLGDYAVRFAEACRDARNPIRKRRLMMASQSALDAAAWLIGKEDWTANGGGR